ncbi:MAG: chemotaxis protein CheX [Calditrichota bacterium]
MSIEVALIDFPRLQEQIASRLLAEHKVTTKSMSHTEAEARLGMYNLALYFWPDKAGEAVERLKKIRSGENQSVPIVLVTSEAGKSGAEAILGPEGVADILVTPLQPHIVSRKLSQLLGIQKPQDNFSLDVAWVAPFVEGTVDTLKQMAGMECERTGLAARMDAVAKGDITGTMGLSGSAEGVVSVTFDHNLARKIVCKMLQIEIGEETEEDLRDGVGEFMNMVAGQAKAGLAHTEHSFQLSLPQVIVGGSHTVGQIRGMPVIVIEFETEGDRFEVMICLIPRKRD